MEDRFDRLKRGTVAGALGAFCRTETASLVASEESQLESEPNSSDSGCASRVSWLSNERLLAMMANVPLQTHFLQAACAGFCSIRRSLTLPSRDHFSIRNRGLQEPIRIQIESVRVPSQLPDAKGGLWPDVYFLPWDSYLLLKNVRRYPARRRQLRCRKWISIVVRRCSYTPATEAVLPKINYERTEN